ncbi:MAG: glycosyltransferase [Flavobacteriaceae bacterium]
MKNIIFLTNVDWFYDMHIRALERGISEFFKPLIIVGDSGYFLNYDVEKFSIKSRIPKAKAFFKLHKILSSKKTQIPIIVITPVMIILFHFLFPRRKHVYYYFTGLGFLRNLSKNNLKILFNLLKIFPFAGKRIIVTQNKVDYEFMQNEFILRKKIKVTLIPGCGFKIEKPLTIEYEKRRKNCFGYVGRIRKEKGIIELIKAVNELKSEKHEIDLKIWGEMDDENRHGFNKEEISFLNTNNKYFKGFSTNKQEIYQSFDWFCLPSNGEGLSMSAIEASAYSKPMILSNVPGNSDMINGNGFLFEFGDLLDIKNQILSAINLNDDEFQKMGKISRKLFEQKWSLEKVTESWLSLIKENSK